MLLTLFPAAAGTEEVELQGFCPPWPLTPPQPPTPPQPELTVEINPAGSGNYSQSELIPRGWDFYGYCWLVSLTAIPADGWEFDYWSCGGPFAGESSETTYDNFPIYDDITITANFKRKSYILSLEANPAEGGCVYADDVADGGNYYAGDTVKISAEANPGYEFENWTIGGKIESDEAEFDFTMPAADTTLVANFKEHEPGIGLEPGISVTKEASHFSAYRGDEITYTITVENTGDIDFDKVCLSDPLLGLNNVDIGPLYASGSEGETTFKEDYTYTIPSDSEDFIENTVTVTAFYGEEEGISDVDSCTVYLLPKPDITITKEASKSSAYRGDEITYTITVENTGEVDFYSVYLSDPKLEIEEYIGPLYTSDEPIKKSYTYTIPSDEPYGPMTNTAYVEAWGEGGYAAHSIEQNGNYYNGGFYADDEDSATVEILEQPSSSDEGSSGGWSSDDYDWGPSEPTQPQPQPEPEPEPEPEEEVTEIIPEVPEAPPAPPVEVTEETPEEAPEEVVEEVIPELPKTGGNALLLLGLGSLLGGAGILFERRRARKR
jgi:uncharacterized repeat protein (TIGR01451 family)/LPXTG-motif cell wall-anchored protein